MQTKTSESNVRTMREVVRYIGIDPGGHTGIVELIGPAGSLAGKGLQFSRSASLTSTSYQKRSAASNRANIGAKVAEWLVQRPEPVAAVAMEEPRDGMSKWSGGTARGTSFALGAHFGIALYAVAVTLDDFARTDEERIFTYTVGEWMPRAAGRRGLGHTQKREITLANLRVIARALGMTRDRLADVSEHELMALGVLLHHLQHKPDSNDETRSVLEIAQAPSREAAAVEGHPTGRRRSRRAD